MTALAIYMCAGAACSEWYWYLAGRKLATPIDKAIYLMTLGLWPVLLVWLIWYKGRG
jgi:hypothetical protein